jgi:hypothetical protein
MKFVLKDYDSATLDLATYVPPSLDCFSFDLTLHVGSRDKEDRDLFHAVICTPKFLLQHQQGDEVTFGRGLIIVMRYDWAVIKRAVDRFVEGCCTHDEWDKVAACISKIAVWEDEDNPTEMFDRPKNDKNDDCVK